MRARVLFAGVVVISTVVLGSPASAKVSIAEATITGPGISGEVRIGRRHTMSLWEYGIGPIGGGSTDSRADSVEALGLSSSDLGGRYQVTYRFDPQYRHDPIRQDLYPYAEDGPVTYIPRQQKLTGLFGDHGLLQVIPGWHQSGSGFLSYLESHGLPETNAATSGAAGDAAPGPSPEHDTSPSTTIVAVLGGLTALLLATIVVRRRVPGSRVHR
jgi:hypothetical protein